MSSLKFDSDFSGDEVQSFTVHWNHCTTVGHKPRKRETRDPIEVPQILNSLINFLCMLAGVATILTAIGFATGWIHIEGLFQ